MKALYKAVVFIFFLSVCSCKKDKDNNIYTEKEIISVKGIEANYPVITGRDNIVIDPEVSSNKEGELEYLWGLYETNVQGYTPVLDTICKTKRIDYPVNRTAKDWFLVLRVTNKSTGYAQYFNATISVGTEFTRGWYVIKDENNKTDLDLFLTPQNISPTAKRENVYSLINGKKLEGNALTVRFYSDYKAPLNGTYGNTRSVFLVSDKDVSVVNLSTLKEIHDFNGLFYGDPDVKSPGFVGNDFLVYYMVNAGQLYSIVGQGPSQGKFGGRKIKGGEDTPYNLSKYHLMFIASYFFDEMSSSFVSASDRSLYLTSVADNPATELSANNNNKKMLFMGAKTTSPLAGFAVFQDKTDPSLKSLVSISPNVASFRMVNDVLKPTDKIYNGSNFALLFQDENMIYFTVGNEVWSRNLSNKFEQLQFTVPANETVTFIRHRKYTGAGVEAPYSYNYVMIGTKSAGNYKIRMFTKASGNLAAEPAFTLEGKGSPADAVYISPSVSSSTYPNSY